MTAVNGNIQHADFHISYTCNRSCPFCSEAARLQESPIEFIPAPAVIEKLKSLNERGVKSVLFTGGEIFLHPGLLDIVNAAAELSMRVCLSTNGVCVDRDFFDSIAPRINLLQVSFHASNSQLYDEITGQPGSFDELESFIKHAKKYVNKMYFMANIVMSRQNAPDILDAVKKICSYEMFKMILLSNLAPEGRALENYSDKTLRLSEITEIVEQVKFFLWRGNIELHVFGVPFCSLGRHGANSNDLFWRPLMTVELDPAASSAGKIALMETISDSCSRERTKPEKCALCRCNIDTFCGGVFTKYYEIFGDSEISPVQPSANISAGSACPA